jgi:hemolysin activation/secretion protein
MITAEPSSRPVLKPSAVSPFVLKRPRISGNTAFTQEELIAVVQDYIGKEVGYADLDAAARIARYYRERGYRVALAYLCRHRRSKTVW